MSIATICKLTGHVCKGNIAGLAPHNTVSIDQSENMVSSPVNYNVLYRQP